VQRWDDFVEVLGCTTVLAYFEKFMKSRFIGIGNLQLIYTFDVRRETIFLTFRGYSNVL